MSYIDSDSPLGEREPHDPWRVGAAEVIVFAIVAIAGFAIFFFS